MSDPSGPLGLYVHIPFCEAKCTYCHFAIDALGEQRHGRYLNALLAEIRAVDGVGRTADTVYLGGGTPSLFSVERLASMLALLRERFRIAPDAEITLEANPHDLDLGGCRALRGLGVTRLSLGVQSLDDGVLAEMGRRHTAADARRAFDLARETDFASVSVDLILGWPGETRDRWSCNLDGVAAMRPDHVSLYVLEVEGKTLLAHRQRQGRLALPDDDLIADLYRDTVDRLDALGIERYEISNFARAGHASRHNGKYWDDQPFLGFGMSAHSSICGRRSWNLDTYAAYCGALEEGRSAVAGSRTLSPRERAGEALFTGLRRREGVALERFRARYGLDALEAYGPALRDAFDARLIEVAEGRLRLTEAGVLLSNEVFQAFV